MNLEVIGSLRATLCEVPQLMPRLKFYDAAHLYSPRCDAALAGNAWHAAGSKGRESAACEVAPGYHAITPTLISRQTRLKQGG